MSLSTDEKLDVLIKSMTLLADNEVDEEVAQEKKERSGKWKSLPPPQQLPQQFSFPGYYGPQWPLGQVPHCCPNHQYSSLVLPDHSQWGGVVHVSTVTSLATTGLSAPGWADLSILWVTKCM